MKLPRIALLFAAALYLAGTAARAAEATAEEWWNASVALAKPGQIIAVLQIHPQDQRQGLEFRYDRLPGLERVIAPDGATFARSGTSGWMVSTDWGKTGSPAPADEAAEMDAVSAIAQKPFQAVEPDPVEGRMVFSDAVGGLHFRQRREKKRTGGYDPEFDFSPGLTDKADTLLWRVRMDCKWLGGPAFAVVRYFYRPSETAPPAGGFPEDRVVEELRAAAAKPFKVDAVIHSQKRVRVAGIVSGRDFDFTIVDYGLWHNWGIDPDDTAANPGKVSRQIAVGDDSWLSVDGGKSWQKQSKTDRAYFDMLRHPVDAVANDAMHWPFDAAVAVDTAGVTLRSLVANPPGEPGAPGRWIFRSDSPRYQVAFTEGKGAALRSCDISYLSDEETQGRGFASVHADYSDTPDARVQPPPGGPAIVPAERPEDLLVKALEAMKTGVWRVVWGRTLMAENGNGADNGQWKSNSDTGGLISGRDFDLTYSYYAAHGSQKITERRIGIKGKDWITSDGGATWKEVDDTQASPMAFFTPTPDPFSEQANMELYESLGAETHDGETWLHIRMVENNWSRGCHYWLLLDKAGKPVTVRRCAWEAGEGLAIIDKLGRIISSTYEIEEFTPAKEGEKIAPPKETTAN